MRILLAFLLFCCGIVQATDIRATVPASQPLTIQGGSIISFNLDVWGCDTVDVYVQGGPLGSLKYPYTVTFSSVALGANLVQVVYCDVLGRTGTNSVTINSISTTPIVPVRRIKRP
jgi:hypothetical protein